MADIAYTVFQGIRTFSWLALTIAIIALGYWLKCGLISKYGDIPPKTGEQMNRFEKGRAVQHNKRQWRKMKRANKRLNRRRSKNTARSEN